MVYVMFADGFEEIEALTVVDILRRANIEVKSVRVGDRMSVTGAHAIKIECDMLLKDIDECAEMIVLPGGMPGTVHLDESKELHEVIAKFHSSNKYIAAICAAPMILGKKGYLKGKKATCYPSFEQYLHGAQISCEKVCVDGGFITSRGPSTAPDFAFAIIEVLKGKEVKDKLLGDMLYDNK